MKRLKYFRIVIFVLLCLYSAAEVHALAPVIAHSQKKEAAEAKTAASTNGVEKVKTADTNSVDRMLYGIGEYAKKATAKYSWSRKRFYEIPVWRLVGVGFFILLGFVLRFIINLIMREQLASLIAKASRGKVSFDRILFTAARKPLGTLILVTGFAAAAAVLLYQDPNPNHWKYLRNTYTVVLAILLIWFMFRCIDVISQQLMQRARRTKSQVDDQVVPLVRKSLKIVLCIIIILWAFSVLGINITALVAGLGIGGLAVALGLQDTLANLFGSIFIMLDHPFRVGDRIVVDNNVDGIVEQLGLRSTRIRTLNKTLVCIPNKTVANATIDNIARMPMRKAVQTIGLTYETTADQMEEIVEELHAIIRADEDIDQEFTLVNFTDFGESSLNITVIYFTKTADYAKFQKIKQRTNLAFMRAIRARGLSVAFPTRSLYIENTKVAEQDIENALR